MKTKITRRQLLKLPSVAGFGAAFASRTVADEIGASATSTPVADRARCPARLVDGKMIQTERPLAVMHETYEWNQSQPASNP